MTPIDRLLVIMARLRDPERGCPWDREQTFDTIAPHTLEEAFEVADAIARGDMDDLRDELGDLLFQVVFYAQMAGEAGRFSFDDIATGICDKLERRHPHVFADARIDDAAAQSLAWERHKAGERAARASAESREPSLLDGVGRALPALIRATKLQRRAADVGFDWPDVDGVLDKLEEEIAELREVLGEAQSPARRLDELGDLLFTCANLGRHLGLDAESALRAGNDKFERRFKAMETYFRLRGEAPGEVSPEALEAAWERVKSGE
jgi:MazG family protein